MDERIEVICTAADLARFARGEILYNELIQAEIGEPFAEFQPVFEETYKMTWEDLHAAFENALKYARTADEFFYGWFEPLILMCGEAAELAKLAGRSNVKPVEMMYEERNYFPRNRETQVQALIQEIGEDDSLHTAFVLEDDMMPELITNYMQQMDLLDRNITKELREWEFTDRQKEQILRAFEEEEEQKMLSEREQILFRKILEEMCTKDNVLALKILGYACYGTDSDLYPCDWVRSRDCMLKIMEHGDDEHQAMAANTLGYIYYYGRCAGGIPEYEQAFKYFALASFFGFYQATYKVGDMLAEGKGVPKNTTAAYGMYEKVYSDCFERFQDGDERQSFADAALRMGNAFSKEIGVPKDPMTAYYFYLQAKAAIDIRMRETQFFGDRKVLEGIEAGLAETRQQLIDGGIDVDAEATLVDPECIFTMLMYGGRDVTLEVEKEDEGCKIVAFRGKRGCGDDETLITVPEVSYSKRRDKVVLRSTENTKFKLKKEKKEVGKITFDEIKSDTERVKLYRKDKHVATIRNPELIFRPDEQI